MKYGDIVVYNGTVGKVVTDTTKKDETSFRFLPCKYGSYYPADLEEITEENTREATHEEKVMLISKEYVWGRVIKVHCIGDYQIIEAVDKKGEVHWHSYIDYDDTCTSYKSLDSALVGCIAIKHDGVNSRAAMYFCKMIDLDTK